jgi:hypothetical protein
MANEHGSVSQILVHDGTSLRNISPYVKTIDVNRSRDANDVTCKGATGKTYRGGLTDGEVRLTGLWDDTALVGTRTVMATIQGSATGAISSVEVGMEGATSGDTKDTFAGVLTQYDESSPVDDMVAFTATIKISGAVTPGTFS